MRKLGMLKALTNPQKEALQDVLSALGLAESAFAAEESFAVDFTYEISEAKRAQELLEVLLYGNP